ncbi:hypothetical protein [Bradyrhizobium sp. Tv2a-2]|uniref:hypothetical protein n=1 Tax=Bradyrhizobium sp. Tv2a-2 TaxID=113395 RepID=UPI0003FF2A8F|nr:hypothetical protein [Bradyrhizobium sp. Tv2a-2]
MATDPIIQGLIDLFEPPEDGHAALPSSAFGASRSKGTNPHVGFDVSRGRGVLPHGRVNSPVYGKIKEIQSKLGRIVIEERYPGTNTRTGYDVEILHTQSQMVKAGDTVVPMQQIGTQGDVGAPGAFHAHIQVFHGDRTPLNPLRHLFEYHHPGAPVPPLPEFEPLQVPPRVKGGSALQPDTPRPPVPGAVPTPDNPPLATAPAPRIPKDQPRNPGPPLDIRPPAQSRSPVAPAPTPSPSLPPSSFGREGSASNPPNFVDRWNAPAPAPSSPGIGGFAPPGQANSFNDRFGNWKSDAPDGSVSSPAPEGRPGGLPGMIMDYLQPQGERAARRSQAQPTGLPSQPGTLGGAVDSQPDQQQASAMARPGLFASSFLGGKQNGSGGLAGLFGSNPVGRMPPGRLPRPETLFRPLPFMSGSLPDKPPLVLARPDVRFPLEALLAPDRDKALDEWSSARPPRQAVPRAPAPDSGGSIADLIMNYIRSQKAQDADQSQRPAFNTDAAPMPPISSYVVPSTDGEDVSDDPRGRASIRRLSRFAAL